MLLTKYVGSAPGAVRKISQRRRKVTKHGTAYSFIYLFTSSSKLSYQYSPNTNEYYYATVCTKQLASIHHTSQKTHFNVAQRVKRTARKLEPFTQHWSKFGQLSLLMPLVTHMSLTWNCSPVYEALNCLNN